jgi:predicted metal-dependent peptidase
MAELDRVKLLVARYRAATDRPYLASALYSLTVVPSTRVPTMAVDRHWRCYASPAFVAETPVPELAGVWIHEVAHLLRDHHGRAERLPAADQRDRLRVNVAQDCEIKTTCSTTDWRCRTGGWSPGRSASTRAGCSRSTSPTCPGR